MRVTHSAVGSAYTTRQNERQGCRGGGRKEKPEFLIIDKNVCTRVASQKRSPVARFLWTPAGSRPLTKATRFISTFQASVVAARIFLRSITILELSKFMPPRPRSSRKRVMARVLRLSRWHSRLLIHRPRIAWWTARLNRDWRVREKRANHHEICLIEKLTAHQEQIRAKISRYFVLLAFSRCTFRQIYGTKYTRAP